MQVLAANSKQLPESGDGTTSMAKANLGRVTRHGSTHYLNDHLIDESIYGFLLIVTIDKFRLVIHANTHYR